LGLILDPKVSIQVNTSRSNLLQDIIIGVMSLAVFYVAAYLVIQVLQTAALSLGLLSIVSLMAEVQPVFAGNTFLSFVVFGLLVPIIENLFFFGVLMEFIADKSNTILTLKNYKAHLIYTIVAFLFMFIHITAKGIPQSIGQIINEPSLLVTFIFGYMSCMVVVISKKQLRPSIFMHQVANILAIIKRGG